MRTLQRAAQSQRAYSKTSWECGPAFESQQAAEVSPPGAEFNPKKIFGFGGGAIRADFGGRAPGRRRWHRFGSRELTPLDVAGRAMEPTAEAEETLPTQGAQSSLRRTSAAGREFP